MEKNYDYWNFNNDIKNSVCKADGGGGKMPKRQRRITRCDITVFNVDPVLWALGYHIAECFRKGEPMHVPPMRGSEWGHVLRALKIMQMWPDNFYRMEMTD
ncbi:hypothetical protein [Serratia symbiotica]|uniref:hypothetical protein n=1 Tax=Serratia symbiotica TaxID=138074 RepID=UPI001E3E7A30|nr:hypothetical protein [Serratia symbiotica]